MNNCDQLASEFEYFGADFFNIQTNPNIKTKKKNIRTNTNISANVRGYLHI